MALGFISGNVLPAPSQCVSCGTIGVDMIDAGKNEAFYGAVLICTHCFREAAIRIAPLNLVPLESYEHMQEHLTSKIGLASQIGPALDRLKTDLNSAMGRINSSFAEHNNPRVPDFEVPDGSTISAELDKRDAEDDQQYFYSVSELLRTASD